MRDQAVEAMVEVAQSCAPGGVGTKADAVKAVRMCLDILELMKLVRISICSPILLSYMLDHHVGYCESPITDFTAFPH